MLLIVSQSRISTEYIADCFLKLQLKLGTRPAVEKRAAEAQDATEELKKQQKGA